MTTYFAPNNNDDSMVLYTGRTNDLEKIFKIVLDGNCIALYGERRSGKTLTLEIIKAIINGDKKIKGDLTDKKFQRALPRWTAMFQNYKSLYVSLSGLRTDQELHDRILESVQEAGLIEKKTKRNGKDSSKTYEVLDKLQLIAEEVDKKILVLIDEMETLGDFENGNALAELFCDRVRYSKLLFIHTGSYLWLQRVDSPGSLFTHVIPYHIRSVDKEDLMIYLLKPLKEKNLIEFTANMSGCKPLYAQHIGKRLFEEDEQLNVETLLGDTTLNSYIRTCIYNERNLDDLAKKILVVLAHHPGVSTGWVAAHLQANESDVKERLNVFENFGTVNKNATKYRVNGLSIEAYGRQYYDNPTLKEFGKPAKLWYQKVAPPLKWCLTVCFVIFAIWVYFYSNPSNIISIHEDNLQVVRVEHPFSLEENEDCTITIWATNRDLSNAHDLSFVFDSESIRYAKDGQNLIIFKDVDPGVTMEDKLNCRLRSDGEKDLSTKVSSNGKVIFSYNIQFRSFPTKQYSIILSSLSSLLGLVLGLLPGKLWINALRALNDMLSRKAPIDE